MQNDFQNWEDLLNPEIFKSNLVLSSVYIAIFENTKDYFIEQPKSFFSNIYDSEKGFIVSPKYKIEVLSLDKNYAKASLLWFKKLNAITDEDIEIYSTVRIYRNRLAHELINILLDQGLDQNEYQENLNKLITLRVKIEKWWILDFELDENQQDITESDITSGGELIYTLFMNLLSDNKDTAYYFLNEMRKRHKK